MEMRLKLVRPRLKHSREAEAFAREFKGRGETLHGAAGLGEYPGYYLGWIKKLDDDRTREADQERVPAETFFLVKEVRNPRRPGGKLEKIIGIVNIRLELNNKLRLYGGHIGYSIRATERRHGYGKIMLYLALKFCAERQMEAVRIDCDSNNLASERTILALGGKLLDQGWMPVSETQPTHGALRGGQRDAERLAFIKKFVISPQEAVESYAAKYSGLVEWPPEV